MKRHCESARTTARSKTRRGNGLDDIHARSRCRWRRGSCAPSRCPCRCPAATASRGKSGSTRETSFAACALAGGGSGRRGGGAVRGLVPAATSVRSAARARASAASARRGRRRGSDGLAAASRLHGLGRSAEARSSPASRGRRGLRLRLGRRRRRFGLRLVEELRRCFLAREAFLQRFVGDLALPPRACPGRRPSELARARSRAPWRVVHSCRRPSATGPQRWPAMSLRSMNMGPSPPFIVLRTARV